jgi:enoyl-[acyl-carrier protein] reductase I
MNQRRGVVLGVSGENSVGWSIAQRLAAGGARVAMTCRPSRVDALAPLAARLDAQLLPVDLDDESTIATAFARLGQDDSPLDFLVHTWVHVDNAVLARPLSEISRQDFSDVLAAGAWSLVAACRHAAPLLARSAAPRVVALTSGLSQRTSPNYHVAGIAKAALEASVRYLAFELGRKGVLVNAASFSLVATDGARRAIGDKNAEATRNLQAKRSHTGRAVEAAEVASTVAWLAGPEVQNMTGEILTVDGGFGLSYL